MKTLLRKIRNRRGQSLAEFAVTTAMMATLATTAAPKFSGVGEGAKEKKTMAEIDKVTQAGSNFYNKTVTNEGRGRFPGQEKYDETVGGYASEILLLTVIGDQAAEADAFSSYNDAEGAKWRSVFGIGGTSGEAVLPSGSTVVNDAGSAVGHTEFLAEFGSTPIKSAFQDGHYIYIVIPGGIEYVDSDGDGTYTQVACNTCPPILYVADNENPKDLWKKLAP